MQGENRNTDEKKRMRKPTEDENYQDFRKRIRHWELSSNPELTAEENVRMVISVLKYNQHYGKRLINKTIEYKWIKAAIWHEELTKIEELLGEELHKTETQKISNKTLSVNPESSRENARRRQGSR